jgi:hypothetical protein
MMGSGRLGTPLHIMLLLLILVAWLVVFVLCVAICRMAALGDARPAPEAPRSSRRPDIVIDGLVVWEELSELALRDTTPGGKILRGRRLAAHGIPHHTIPYHGISQHGIH